MNRIRAPMLRGLAMLRYRVTTIKSNVLGLVQGPSRTEFETTSTQKSVI